MRGFLLWMIAFLYLESVSCACYQRVGQTYIYEESELDSKPNFPGGHLAMKRFIKKNLKWPEEYGNNGYVVLPAVVKQNGSISDIKVKRTLCHLCDISAVEVVKKMPRWNPGSLNKKRVNTRIQIPVRFEIDNL